MKERFAGVLVLRDCSKYYLIHFFSDKLPEYGKG